eukprot:jgi/Undpi1/11177/HiC_scaffold_30.g13475.m1
MAWRANSGCSFRHGSQRCNDLGWCTRELPRGGVEKEKEKLSKRHIFLHELPLVKTHNSSISTASTLGPPLSISRLSCQLQLTCYTMMATEERGGPDWDQADSETGKLLAFTGIGGGEEPAAASGGRRGGGAGSGGGAHSQRNQPPGQKMNMCGLLSLQFYQPYFDVDTSQVKARLLQAAQPMRHTEPFLRTGDAEEGEGGGGEPDLYGPVWVSATLIFFLSVVTNARRGATATTATTAEEYDEVSTSAYCVLFYLATGSVGLWAFFRAHGVPLSAAEALSIYGYSLTPFLPAAPLCFLSWPFRWFALQMATMVAAVFVLRSAWPRLHEHMPEKSRALLLAAITGYHCVWLLILLFALGK